MTSPEVSPAPVYFVDDTEQDDNMSDVDSVVPSDTTGETMSTLESQEAIEYFQELNGRMFPADENLPIALPTDLGEVKRLMLQHIQLKIFLGGNFYGPVREMLAPTQDQRQKRVLDLITAEGSWVQDMAKDYPHVHFTSVDNTPLVAHTPQRNITYEVYDLYNGIAEQSDSFDVVHLRHAAMHLKNPKALVREIYRVLRPGGLFIFGNWELSAYEATVPDRPAFEKLPHLNQALRLTRQGLTGQGVDVYMCHDMHQWLRPESDVWDIPGDPSTGVMNSFAERMLGFQDIGYVPFMVPIGVWPTEKRMKDVATIGRHGWAQIWRSMYAPFQVFGMSPEAAKQAVDQAIEDLDAPGVQVSVKYHATFGFKRFQ
ncbi:methyltransferase domain protein [Ceratobasidium sp. AG-Ba]|nr:methyltransferase domain protein [Ceratobasidium sp. AG-Ba]